MWIARATCQNLLWSNSQSQAEHGGMHFRSSAGARILPIIGSNRTPEAVPASLHPRQRSVLKGGHHDNQRERSAPHQAFVQDSSLFIRRDDPVHLLRCAGVQEGVWIRQYSCRLS